jgi:hypothetical protein
MEISDLEPSSGMVRATAFDSRTSAFDLLTTPAARDAWQASATRLPVGGGPIPFTQIVLQGASGWVIQNDRTVINGARLSGGAWVPWQPPCLGKGGPAALAASTSTDLVAACTEGIYTGPTIAVRIHRSTDGATFPGQDVVVPGTRSAEAAASPVPSTVVIASSAGLVATFERGTTWGTALPGSQTRSFNDLGFTSTSQGVVVGEEAGATGQLFMTPRRRPHLGPGAIHPGNPVAAEGGWVHQKTP